MLLLVRPPKAPGPPRNSSYAAATPRLGLLLNEVSDGAVLTKVVAAKSAPRDLAKILVDGPNFSHKEK
ncbi:hypothetical protein [Cupriavidus basilensis]|uniref:hypothetical protein n=1 Tax=Cupriavidus basilensis TaxID=68895 RepID=UPI001F514488|nr:hypothetical protein [Cupriavidus basilensis]